MRIGYSGGDERTRTADPLHAKQVLYQLSYTPRHRFRATSKLLAHRMNSSTFRFVLVRRSKIRKGRCFMIGRGNRRTAGITLCST